jgi:predicted metal-dependent enzyme (double-stranded beta helix superfamily)
VYSIKDFSSDLEYIVSNSSSYEDIIRNGAYKMSSLLDNDVLFDNDFINKVRNNEIDNTLYRSTSNNFVIQLFTWEGNSTTPIHDHFTWGLMGIYYNKLKVVEYSLKKINNNTYDLNETNTYIATEGDICYVLPPNEEIHKISNPTNKLSISIHIYGKPIDKYNIYDLEKNRMYHINS